MRERRAPLERLLLTAHQLHLEQQHLFVGKAAPRLSALGHRRGEMHGAQGAMARHEPVSHAQLVRKRVVHASARVQSSRGQAAYRCARQPLRRPVDGHDPARGRVVVGVELIEKRRGHTLEAVVEFHRARDAHPRARRQRLRKPRLPEERDDHGARAVDERHLGQFEAGLGAFDLHFVHARHHRRRLPDGRRSDGLQPRHVYIATREIRQQVAHGLHAQTRKRRRPGGADARELRHGRIRPQSGGESVDHVDAACRYSSENTTG